MLKHSVDVSGTSYFVAGESGLQQARADVVAAVRAGGDVVDIAVAGGSKVAVLVSPGDSVVFRSDTVDSGADGQDMIVDPFFPFSALDPFDADFF